MAEQAAIPLIVLTRHQDNVEAINSTLRNAGLAAHCNWIRELNDLADALAQINPQLLIAFVGPDAADTAKVMAVVGQSGHGVPVVIARDQVDEDIIAGAMEQGARDAITLKNPIRLKAVVSRELDAHKQARSLSNTLHSAREYRAQLKSFMAGSADAIAYVQEGILVDANPAWGELYGYSSLEDLVGMPLMDIFDPSAHAALKGALVACMQGKWSDHSLRAAALLNDGSSVPLDMELTIAEFDGEPAVRLCVPSQKKDAGDLDEQLTDALEHDAATGTLQRKFFVQWLKESLAQPIKAGVRHVVSIQPDRLEAIADEVGPLSFEDFVSQFAGMVNEVRQPNDLIGRFGDGNFMLLMERGTTRDIETWGKHLNQKISGQVLRIGDKQISCTCTIGIGMVDPRNPDAGAAIIDAISARVTGHEAGGNRVHLVDRLEEDTKRQASDEIWVKRIKAALMENRFRLMQQPVASLLGGESGMYDVLVRMIDEQGQELLPGEFMAAAERNDLMKNIDRWVIGAAMSVCASRKVSQLFVRLSKDSMRDKSLLQWLANQLKASRIDPSHIVFQISEQNATEHLADVTELANGLRKIGFLFAIEHFGTGRDPQRLLAHLPLNFVKIDGTLMQGLAVDQNQQQKVREFVDQARERSISTIAERVEDANTMAVLWQLGIEFIQGYFVNEPEQVTIG